ncbi:hypothetical protein C2845_PM07G08910 [Panicum miliaceum]|uniref:Uncharacterized protein n=1 Tax=Panicum miliaceum TaxID=4540 RepID=A0A3L6SHA3_PANMI|nr:hypothetical protein C2845_PM07G08910 [Panicum miliaceum]
MDSGKVNSVPREPFSDLTNTHHADVDSKKLKRQRERAQPALTEEQKSERNKKRRATYRMKKEITREKESSRAETEHSLQQTIKLTGPIHADDEEDSDWLHRSDSFIKHSDVGQGIDTPGRGNNLNSHELNFVQSGGNQASNASVDKDQILAYHSNNTGAEIIEPESGNNLRRDDISVIQEDSNNEVYIESSAEPETAAENIEIHCNPKPLRNNVPRGEPNTLQKCRSTKFQAAGVKKRVIADGVDNSVVDNDGNIVEGLKRTQAPDVIDIGN